MEPTTPALSDVEERRHDDDGPMSKSSGSAGGARRRPPGLTSVFMAVLIGTLTWGGLALRDPSPRPTAITGTELPANETAPPARATTEDSAQLDGDFNDEFAIGAGNAALPAGLSVQDVDTLTTRGDYSGQPAPGSVLWGATVPGNDNPTRRHEGPGMEYGVRRSFFQWRHATTWLVDVARDDIINERVPWVSVKTPGWQAVADGDHDDVLDAMILSLRELRGPVWLTMHHEPEGGGANGDTADDQGGPAAHVAMNRHVRSRLDALGADNVALAPVLMAWTFNPQSGRTPDAWWADDIYDFLGIDTYTQRESSLVQTQTWDTIRTWAAKRDVDVAVGEWGVLGGNAAAMEEFHAAAVSSGGDPDRARITALAYWDNDKDRATGWTLDGTRLEVFESLLTDSASAHWTDAWE